MSVQVLLYVASVLTASPYQWLLGLKRYMRGVVVRVRPLFDNEKFGPDVLYEPENSYVRYSH